MRLLTISLLALLTGAAHGDSTIDSTRRFAYAANGGWLNWKWNTSAPHGAVVTESLLSGFIYSSNFGWINLGNGNPANGFSYSQTGGEFGVNHDGGGHLSGFAYGANIGWINFDWKTGNDPNEPRIDLATGRFSGFAYGTNVGWIRLDASATAFLETDSLHCPDTDMDGIADWWERRHAGNLTRYNNSSDRDGDGVSDRDEYGADTDPEDASNFLAASPGYTPGATTFTVTFPSRTSRLYQIETGTALTGWADSGLGTFAPSAGATTSKNVSIAGSNTDPKRFFRVIARKPLQP